MFPRDIICLRNISTLHKVDDDDDDDDNDNNNRIHNIIQYLTSWFRVLISGLIVSQLLIKLPQFMDPADLILHNDVYLILYNIYIYLILYNI